VTVPLNKDNVTSLCLSECGNRTYAEMRAGIQGDEASAVISLLLDERLKQPIVKYELVHVFTGSGH